MDGCLILDVFEMLIYWRIWASDLVVSGEHTFILHCDYFMYS
jgi:hypothetical protein